MTIVRWDPFRDFGFAAPHTWTPAVDIYQTGDHEIVLKAELPDMAREDIDVTVEKTNKVTNWAMEMGSPNGLMRQGWTRNTMKIGDVVTVEGSMAKDGSPTGNARSVTMMSTGQRLFAASSQGTTP